MLSLRNQLSTDRALEIDFRRATEVHLSELHYDGMRARRPAQGAVLTTYHCAVRFNFVREHHNWQICHWSSVFFTDESIYTETTNDRRARMWIPHGERYAGCNTVEVD